MHVSEARYKCELEAEPYKNSWRASASHADIHCTMAIRESAHSVLRHQLGSQYISKHASRVMRFAHGFTLSASERADESGGGGTCDNGQYRVTSGDPGQHRPVDCMDAGQ